MIAPSSAGGPVDVIARVVAQGLGEVLGQQVVVDNRAGAAGLIGAELVATASPDGYTLLFGFSGPLVIVPHLGGKTPYDTLKDFAPVSLATQGPYILLVRPSLPVNSVKELIALAKQQPGKLNYASGGNGTGIHLAGELFKLDRGRQHRARALQRRGPGHDGAARERSRHDVQRHSPPALPHVKSGKLKALAVGGTKRSPLLPDIPTVCRSERARFQYDAAGTASSRRRKTPRAIVNKVHAATVKALASPAVKDTLARQGVEPVGSTPEEFAQAHPRGVGEVGESDQGGGPQGQARRK